MAHPPKVAKLCAELKAHIQSHYSAGDKIPSERMMSAQMGISSRTLGIVLRKLAEENLICRTKQGTFVCGDELQFRPEEKKQITILLPSSDFYFCGNSRSQYSNVEIINGARKAAVKHNYQVITIPVSDHNSQSEITPEQFRNLPEKSMIMFNSVWFEALFPIFYQKKCRIACLNCGNLIPGQNIPEIDCFLVAYGGCIKKFFPTAVKHFADKGAKNLLYAGSVDDLLIPNAHSYFSDAVRENNMQGEMLKLSNDISCKQLIKILKEKFHSGKFDALHLSLDRFIFSDLQDDFLGEVNIPKNIPILINAIDFCFQENLKKQSEVIYIPTFEYAFQAAEFLISNSHPSVFFEAEYVIEKTT